MKLPNPKKILKKRILVETEDKIMLLECDVIDFLASNDVKKACKVIWIADKINFNIKKPGDRNSRH